MLIAAFFGIVFGIVAALRRNRPADHILRVVSLGGISMPTFWIGLISLYLGFYKLGWFPGAGRLDRDGTRLDKYVRFEVRLGRPFFAREEE